MGQDYGSALLKGRQQAVYDRAHTTGIDRKSCQSGADSPCFRAFPDNGKGHVFLLSMRATPKRIVALFYQV